MTKSNTKSKKGFTIIEVVLVLAIAGLIFLMVFVALPALQRSQRDTQRRDDMARLITAVQNYQSNNRNKIPTDFSNSSKFYQGYLVNSQGGGSTGATDTFDDPSTGEGYTFRAGKCTSASDCKNGSTTGDGAKLGVITYYTNAGCDGEDPKYTQGNNKIAFTIKLEGAGTYCSNN